MFYGYRRGVRSMKIDCYKKDVVIVIVALIVAIGVLPFISGDTGKIKPAPSLEEIVVIHKRNTNVVANPADNLTVSLKPMTFFFGVNVVLKNLGNEPLNTIEWTFSSTGGLFLRGGTGSGTEETIEPNTSL